MLFIIVTMSHYLFYSQIKCLLLKQERSQHASCVFRNMGVVQSLTYNIHPGNIIASVCLLLKSVKTVPLLNDIKGSKTYQWSCYS